MSELRWNPLLEEWVVTATHRQDRTFRPPADYCPLCPTRDPEFPTEVRAPHYEVVVFENKFPSFRPEPEVPAVSGTELLPAAPSQGICEVVLYTDDHDATFAQLPLERIEGLVDVWADRYEELGSLDYVDYVLIFENKGEAVGVTLDHPHGQIYAFPFIPPRVGKELESSSKHMATTKRCIFCDIMAEELKDGRRLVAQTEDFVAFVPFFARYPYEVHVMPRAHVASISDLDAVRRRGLAKILKDVTLGYDSLFGFSFPYMMIMHQAPTDGGIYDHYHLHVEFYPPHRTRDKIKYLAGCESGAGTFINDSLPEEKAAELREAIRRAATTDVPPDADRSKGDGGRA
ncbi:MAG TPA: galactose-1-phosphate uridylyltransferase [Bacillota bacterium]|jgi:UDPglucose--hexose-1-phosphate uridylyltransferase|nr:galactose-1-phosphate uridylyltransferase [Bacillota bacterium]HNY67911.1 galactose-1-phosphate uridylyltransferase [Bacillota bacterium]HOI36735.1 galactose-1-phosphate uridylyltransferase [Bacillota bacterium]HPU74890.1 galactose-1-phosphate uridylyltransferase [Bacillota bacterium]